MLKVKEKVSKLKPLHLFQLNLQEKQIFIFITNSKQRFWVKENQGAWEDIKIDTVKILQANGLSLYSFKGKEYNQLYLPFSKDEAAYLSGGGSRIELNEIMLSKEKLQEIGISRQIDLDLKLVSRTSFEQKGSNECIVNFRPK